MRPIVPLATAFATLFALAGCGGTVSPGGDEDGGGYDAPPAPPAPVGGPEALTKPDGQVVWIGLVRNTVYFSVYGEAIYSIPSAGGAAPSVIAKAGPTGGLYVSNGFAFDATYVYWSESDGGPTNSILRAPLVGGASATVASAGGYISAIALDSGDLYFVDQRHGTISRVPVGGGSPTVVAAGMTTPAAMAIQAGTIYVSDAASDLFSLPVSGGATTKLVKGSGLPGHTEVADFAPGIAVDESSVYYTEYYASDPVLVKVPLGGGVPATLAHTTAIGIALDAKNVYWVTGGGQTNSVEAVPIAGGSVKVLASNQTGAAGPALDTNSVYWGTTKDTVTCGLCGPPPPGINAVWKVAK